MQPLKDNIPQFCFPEGWHVSTIPHLPVSTRAEGIDEAEVLSEEQIDAEVLPVEKPKESLDGYYDTPYEPRAKQITKPKKRKISAKSRKSNQQRLDPPEKCPDCDMTTAWRISLERHFKNKHHGPYKDEPTVSGSGTQTPASTENLIESSSKPVRREVVCATLSSDCTIFIHFKKADIRCGHNKDLKCICTDCQM